MFGSNFEQNFGLALPFENIDPTGGMFGPNAPIGGALTGNNEMGLQPPPVGGAQPAAVPPAPVAGAQAVTPSNAPPPPPGAAPPGQPGQPGANPAAALSPGPLAPSLEAPAAGVKSEFAKGGL